jgi:hypothetical protein
LLANCRRHTILVLLHGVEDYWGNRGCGDGAGGAGWLFGAPPGSFDLSISDGYILAGDGSFYFTS